MSSVALKRGFVDVGDLQVHYRHGGEGGVRPLVMIHASPGSSRQVAPLASLLAQGRRVLAPDTAGNGDSQALPDPVPAIPDLAAHARTAIARIVDGPVDLYGSHTGASIAMEIALAAPQMVRRLVIDGMGLYAADEQSDVLRNYAREIAPDLEGTHLLKVWHFCRDQYLFWPYYNRTAEGRLPNGLPDAEEFHDFVVEVLKAMRTYHRSYRAAFRHPKRDRLVKLALPVLVLTSPSDMLDSFAAEVASLIPGAQRASTPRWGAPDFHAATAATIAEFLDRK
jgi:pimeloyl-ACP methyl ester carboxylesterase